MNTAIRICIIIGSIISSCSNSKTMNSNNDWASDKTKPHSGYSHVNGISMYYEIHGQGKPLVLLHGGGSTIETSFGRIIPELAKHHQLICVELQAHGRTEDRNTPISFEQDAADVVSLLENLKIQKADFFGFSNGGMTALKIAIKYPERCNKIIAGSVLLKRNGTFPRFWEFMKNGSFEQMPRQYKDAFLKVNPDSTKLLNLFYQCANRMINFTDYSDEEIKSIKAPVLLINAGQDVGTDEHITAMAKLIPHCRLAFFPGGHGAYIGEITTLGSGFNIEESALPVMEKFLAD